MIKITVKQLTEAAMNGALNRFFTLEKPVAVAWANRKQMDACNEELKLANERRLALCEKYGTKDPKTGNYFFDLPIKADGTPDFEAATKQTEPGPKKLAFDKELTELWDQVIDTIPGNPVKIADLTGKLTETDSKFLEPFITD